MHYPTHLREAFVDWVDEGLPSVAMVEVNYEPRPWPARRLLCRMGGCTDIMPAELCEELELWPGTTYGAAAQRLLRERARTSA